MRTAAPGLLRGGLALSMTTCDGLGGRGPVRRPVFETVVDGALGRGHVGTAESGTPPERAPRSLVLGARLVADSFGRLGDRDIAAQSHGLASELAKAQAVEESPASRRASQQP
jgi:hypothetical protein